MSEHHLSEQEILRRENLAKIIEMGIDPYPAAKYEVNANAAEIKKLFEENPENYADVCIAGRLMMTRVMGKAAFA